MVDGVDVIAASEASKSLSPHAFGPPTITPGGRVPLRASVRSTSQLPVRDNEGPPTHVPDLQTHQQHVQALLSSQAAMIKQQQETNDCLHRHMENQWKLFQDEKALWRSTQCQLKHRIHQVEAKLRQSSGTNSTTETPPTKSESVDDPTLKDAGHTPMARWSLNMSTGTHGTSTGGDGSSSPKIGGVCMPTEQQETAQQPVRQPREHEDSYFGSVAAPDTCAEMTPHETEIEDSDDRQLEGPLGLTNSPHSERNVFILGEIDKKLNVTLEETVASSRRSQTSPLPTLPSAQAEQMQNADGTAFEVPESEPLLRIKRSHGSKSEAGEPEQPLRIKKSQNFGSALGQGEEVDYGKGFPGRG